MEDKIIDSYNKAKQQNNRTVGGNSTKLTHSMETITGNGLSRGPFSGVNETREFIIGSLGATRKGGVETGTTQEWHLL